MPQLSSLIDVTGQALVLFGMDGRELSQNPVMRRMLGQEREREALLEHVRGVARAVLARVTNAAPEAQPSEDGIGPWLDDALAEKRKIMGFGHRVYKHGDSRVPTMKAALDTLVEHYDRPDMRALYDTLESEFVSRKGIYPNLDYPSGPAYNLIGFDTLTFTPLFVAARVTGWTAHIMEQRGLQRLIRPLSAYNGPDERHIEGYVPDAAGRPSSARRRRRSG